MPRRKVKDNQENALEQAMVSAYVRLCINEGEKPGEAYRKLRQKIKTFKPPTPPLPAQ